ncbi:hypothetical protein [Erythrobacter mangrovi]|uniref:Uncharacterized protein n=1 Tax=Erythrobacter mangrovi TaxID=2739433 RepID=A0A7D4CP25_9SPHN|nr:hypothetical protein [Erythrobacter mangrovi]QKG72528.1 hypothetical protein HQR01_14765 [Erythrobacter mangrovi]
MYDRNFFRTQLGQASLASFLAMTIFAVFSSNLAMSAPAPSIAYYDQVEIA